MTSNTGTANQVGNGASEILEGRYVLGEILGAGSMGCVFSAFDTVRGIRVAVKILHPELVSSQSNLDRFAFEATIASRVQSRHVVRALGISVTRAGVPCIIYEHLVGETLGQLIAREGGVSLACTLEIVKQTSRALAHLHVIGVVHRDVKPDNIFLTRGDDGQLLVKLFDFGISEVADSEGTYAHCQLAGTPEYMSPETLLGTQEVDCGADLYALGVVVFECLTGSCPFPGDLGEVFEKLQGGARAPLTELRPDLHGAVEAWMDRALHPDPIWRFDSIKELRDELERAMRKSAGGNVRAAATTARAAA